MKRTLIMTACILVWCSIIFIPDYCKADEIDELVTTASVLIVEKEFEKLTSLYLYPDSYSEEKIQDEITNISEGLSFLATEFGEIESLEINQDDAQWFEFFMTGGDVEFAKKHPNYLRFTFKATFSNIGEGYVFVHVFENDGQPMLRGSGYGIPASEQTLPVAKEIANKFMKLMKSRVKAKEV